MIPIVVAVIVSIILFGLAHPRPPRDTRNIKRHHQE